MFTVLIITIHDILYSSLITYRNKCSTHSTQLNLHYYSIQPKILPSGTTGWIILTVKGSSGQFRLDFKRPFSGNNKCEISGNIPGLKFERTSFSAKPDGNKAVCIMHIAKKGWKPG